MSTRKRTTKRQAAPRWWLKELQLVTYYSGGLDGTVDLLLIKAAGKRDAGSGYELEGRWRDMEFRFRTEAQARAAAARMQTAVTAYWKQQKSHYPRPRLLIQLLVPVRL